MGTAMGAAAAERQEATAEAQEAIRKRSPVKES